MKTELSRRGSGCFRPRRARFCSSGGADLAALYHLEPLERRLLLAAVPTTLDLDTTFGQGGYARVSVGQEPFGGPWEYGAGIQQLAATPDGKFYAAGSTNRVYGTPRDAFDGYYDEGNFVLTRFNSDGTPDATFGDGGVVLRTDLSEMNWVHSLLVQPDGKVLVVLNHEIDNFEQSIDSAGGVFSSLGPIEQGLIFARFNPDGSLDSSFGTAGQIVIPGDPGTNQAIDGCSTWFNPDGKIVSVYKQGSHLVTLRLQADGMPDLSFAPDGRVVTLRLKALVEAGNAYLGTDFIGAEPVSGGDMVVYAAFDPAWYTQSSAHLLLQYTLDSSGDLLTSRLIGQDAGKDLGYLNVTMLPDGGALVIDRNSMTRFTRDGTPDTTFGVRGAIPASADAWQYDWPFPAPDGKIVMVIGQDVYPFPNTPGIERLNADGSRDATFAGGAVAQSSYDNSLAPALVSLADGSLLVAEGRFSSSPFNFVVTKIRPDGGVPTTDGWASDINGIGTDGPAGPGDDVPPFGAATDVVPAAEQTPTSPEIFNSAAALDYLDYTARPGDAGGNSIDRGLFAKLPGTNVFDPGGTRKPFEDGTTFLAS